MGRTTTRGETMQLLGENKFVFRWSFDSMNRKSRMPSDSFAFFLFGVDCLHLVTGMNIDAISILLCRGMKGMRPAAQLFVKIYRFWVTVTDVEKEKYTVFEKLPWLQTDWYHNRLRLYHAARKTIKDKWQLSCWWMNGPGVGKEGRSALFWIHVK